MMVNVKFRRVHNHRIAVYVDYVPLSCSLFLHLNVFDGIGFVAWDIVRRISPKKIGLWHVRNSR
jgi:hypothetical protein